MSDSQKPTNQSPRKSIGVRIIFIVLVAWALLIAIGTFQTQASTDIRRPLVVVATMSVFLGVWTLALIARAKR